jgi:hypothetical protein
MGEMVRLRQAARQMAMDPGTLLLWCRRGMVPGAIRQSGGWMIPAEYATGEGKERQHIEAMAAEIGRLRGDLATAERRAAILKAGLQRVRAEAGSCYWLRDLAAAALWDAGALDEL